MKKLITISFILLTAGLSSALIAQEVKINSNFAIEADGTFRLNGDATVWDDLMVYPDATTRSGSNPPALTSFANNGSQGVFLWMFDKDTEQELYFTIQIPHSYKLGTSIYPHVHWTTITGTPSGTPTGTTPTVTNVIWGFEYTMIKIGGTFGSTTLITSNTIIPPISTLTGAKQHLITAFGAISGGTAPNDIDVSTVLVCRLYRKAADSNDTFANSVGLLGFDIHYEKDTEGSRTQYEK